MEERGTRPQQAGFTLIEAIVVIVVAGILATIGVDFIVKPIEGYLALSRRATLVDAADNALQQMSREIRQALPNSIRVSSDGSQLELLHTVDGGRYRARASSAGDDILNFSSYYTSSPDTSFDVLGPLGSVPADGDQVVIYNLSASGTTGNDYASYLTPPSDADDRGVVKAGSTVSKIQLEATPAPKFAGSSPDQRFFIVDGPVSYVCDPSGGTLTRYAGYTPNDPDFPTAVANLGTGAIVSRHVSACAFSYQPGAGQRSGLVTLQLTLSDQGESIHLLDEVHVVNAP